MKNNIFSYATGELSQDAFICWLMSYAMKDAENDVALRMCAQDFLRQFIPELSCEENIYISEIPQKQYKSIDVLLTVNEKYKVIIEDKTYTSEHDNQLSRYFDIVCEDYKNFTVKGVYFKTGFQSDLSAIKESGYMYFDRQAILKTIEKYADKTQNRIFRDYYEYLKNLNDEVEKFKTLSVEQWNWHQINGFYEYAKKNNKSDMNYNYGYVHNKDGGFYGMWMYNGTYKYIQDDKYELYLQCEYVDGKFNICYKASAQEDSQKINREIRNKFIWKKENDKWTDIAMTNQFIKPTRFGTGKTVTLGVYSCEIHTYEDALNEIDRAIDSFKKIVENV